jgi:capping protein beta
MDDGFKPNDKLRELEVAANKLFDIYRKLYFTSGYSSAYFFETDEKDDMGFGACFLIHKEIDQREKLKKACWDSIHVFEVIATGKKDEFTYKLTTTVMISLILVEEGTLGTSDLSGLRTQQHEKTSKCKSPAGHVTNMGQMLEDCETRIRNEIEGIYIQKTRTVISGMRGGNNKRQQAWGAIAQSLNASKFHKQT